MKHIKLLINITLIALFLSACGDDGKGSFDTGSQQITVTSCETYITLQSNDLLVKDTANTSVKIVHDGNNNKKVCVVSGSAHIIREN